MNRLALASIALVSLGLLTAAVACSDAPMATTCKNVPLGGCPLSHGVACKDPSCEAAYACTENGWVLDHVCPAHDAGSLDASPARDAVADTSSIRDASIDAPPGSFGGPGCAELQAPECALGVALACSTGCCGCEDLFVCDKGGWTLWGACQNGQITPR